MLAAWLLCAAPVLGADYFGDITVSADSLYSGITSHGYAETRVFLENHSPSRTHNVTLASPNRSFTSGNSIGGITRTVSLAPGVRVEVPLLQPPLPANGDGLIRVTVDGREEGTVRQPNANNHCAYYNRGIPLAATAFVSRSVDADAVERMVNGNHVAYTAAMATGEPDAWGPGHQATAWMPDTRVYGHTNWLEVDFATPISANELHLHTAQTPVMTGWVDLIGVSGTNVGRINLASGITTSRSGAGGNRFIQRFSFSTTHEPVKTVRLDFGTTPPPDITIDAVELDDARGGYFAASARASSDNSAVGASPTSRRISYGGNPDDIQCLRAESALTDWSDNWLAYTPFDVLVLAGADVAALPGPVAAAIGNYLQAGGNVLVIGNCSLPASWGARAFSSGPANPVYEAGFGRIYLLRNC